MLVVETKYMYLMTIEEIIKKWHGDVLKYNLIPF